MRSHGVMCLNIMGAPGCGKTSLLERVIPLASRDGVRAAVVEGDPEGELDVRRLEGFGIPLIGLNTQGGCHLDASMVAAALEKLPLEEVDLLFIENVGNLICPAEFDLGEELRVVVASVTEGDDKPQKYPLMFRRAHAVVLNKMDLLGHIDFSLDEFRRGVGLAGSAAQLFLLSCRTGERVEEWHRWVCGNMPARRGD